VIHIPFQFPHVGEALWNGAMQDQTQPLGMWKPESLMKGMYFIGRIKSVSRERLKGSGAMQNVDALS
jgi:hypothetical protein